MTPCRFIQDGEGQVRCSNCDRTVRTHCPPERVHAACPKTLDPRKSATTPDAVAWRCPNCRQRHKLTPGVVPFQCICGHIQTREIRACRFVLLSKGIPPGTKANRSFMCSDCGREAWTNRQQPESVACPGPVCRGRTCRIR